ncbi:peptidoglycan DD-metalloendopeptidase family protein [Patescibacteria group bacterium]
MGAGKFSTALISVVFALALLIAPFSVSAFSLASVFKNLFSFSGETIDSAFLASSLPVMEGKPLLDPVINVDPQAGQGGAELQIVGGKAMLPVVGPLGNVADADEVKSSRITTYTVREGDNLSVIADTFGVSIGTIFWANDIKRADLIRPGDVLLILPVTGIRHTIARGDTIQSIAETYKGDIEEIIAFNDFLTPDDLIVGQQIIIPNIDMDMPARSYASKVYGSGGSDLGSYFIRPIDGGKKSQGLHGYNAVDLATYCGAPIRASASGNVITARNIGWNGGYGSYVVIGHPNGTQTLYGHMGSVLVGKGWYVVKGQTIGTVGSTGRSTGCHVHFEIRGAKNPF